MVVVCILDATLCFFSIFPTVSIHCLLKSTDSITRFGLIPFKHMRLAAFHPSIVAFIWSHDRGSTNENPHLFPPTCYNGNIPLRRETDTNARRPICR